MVLHIIHADILLIARIFPRPFGARKNTTQLAKYPRALYAKPSIKMYIFIFIVKTLGANVRTTWKTSPRGPVLCGELIAVVLI